LDKVVDQTEAAATGMLDTLERITHREERVIAELKEVRSGIGDWQAEESANAVDGIISRAEANLNDVFQVMDALQFQDITSQQIQHAASVLEDVEFKLKNIIVVMGGGIDQTEFSETQKVRVFDPHADLYSRKTEQADVDSLFAKPEKQ
jgi:chemotaxis regulatin CheY-phosphate phosphatase CheZ